MKLRDLLKRAVPYRWKLALSVLLSLLAALASLAIPWLGAQLLGGVLETDLSTLGSVLVLLIVSLLALTGLSIINTLVSSSTSAKILGDFRVEIFSHIQVLPLTFHDRSRKGDLLSLLSSDVTRMSSFVSQWLASAVSAVFTACGAMLILFWINPSLALFLPVILAAFFVAQRTLWRHLRSISAKVRKAEAQVMSNAEQCLEMLPAAKAFAREELQRKNFERDVRVAQDLTLRQAKIYAVLGPTNQLLLALAVIALLTALARSSSSESMSGTELFGFLLYAALLTRPFGTLANLYGEFNGARGSLARLEEVLDEPREPGYQASRRLSSCQGEVSFSDVWFSYPGRDQTLRGASFDIHAGEIVALTGQNGAGKTTIIRLLLGLYSPQRGTICLDGVDIAQIHVRDLRQQIGYVPQRALLFNGSVRENIGWGRDGANKYEIEKAASLAQALDFIKALPMGFDTQIGDHGLRLSGGQRQRIALARALLKDPPILILDEATSMYDLEGEAAFVEACKSALLGRTVIIITHRSASLALADRIIRMEDGLINSIENRGSYLREGPD